MTNQGVSNERKKELEQMDPFQEGLAKSVTWASAHKKQLVIGVAALVGVVVVFYAIMISFKQSEIKASQFAASANKKYEDQFSKDQDAQKGYDAVKEDFQTLLDEYPNTSAGRLALVNFAKICFEAKKYDQALDLYSRALSKLGDQAGIKNFLLCSLGNLSELKNDTKQAKSYYLRVEQGSSPLLKNEARFALALIYEKLNDADQSLKMYEEIALSQDASVYKAIADTKISGQ